MGKAEKEKIPFWFVWTMRCRPVAASVETTDASGITAPVGSVTVPLMRPVDCPQIDSADRNRRRARLRRKLKAKPQHRIVDRIAIEFVQSQSPN
jgi:hypothetical protein